MKRKPQGTMNRSRPQTVQMGRNMFQLLGDLTWPLLLVAFGVFAYLRPHHLTGADGPPSQIEKRARQMKRFGAALAGLGGLALLIQVVHLCSAEQQFFPYDKGTEFSRKGWYPKHLTAMREPSLYKERSQTGTEFRFLHLPTFHNPSAIRITRTPTGAQLRVVRLSGQGGYDPGTIQLERPRTLDESQRTHFLMGPDSAPFWTSPEEEHDRLGGDRSQVIL